MSYLEELMPAFRKGAKIRQTNWSKGEYIYLSGNGIVYDENNKPFDVTNEELFANWEFYQDPKKEYDWDYIIGHKCLCRFCDDNDCWVLGTLSSYSGLKQQPLSFFCVPYYTSFKNCFPVRRDEVTFYEDKKDE